MGNDAGSGQLNKVNNEPGVTTMNAQDESKQIWAEIQKSKLAKSSNNPNSWTVLHELEQICSSKSNLSNKSITFQSDEYKNILVVSSDPNILLNVARYYQQITGQMIWKSSTVNDKRFGINFQIQLKLKKATDDIMGFGSNWAPIIIDYISESHPNYRLVTASHSEISEKLYFIPIQKHNNNQLQSYKDTKPQSDEGNKATFQ